MIPQEKIQKWQSVWKQLLDMAYYRKGVTSDIFIQNTELNDLYVWARNEPDFEKLTFDYMWERYSFHRDSENRLLEPLEVPELERMFIPNVLFECIGNKTFMKTSFPNCQLSFWEDNQ